MKITSIHINDFQQFNDFHLDLTYPKGHPKEGKPLDKVCFIGQSGTGKTSLLNVVADFVKKLKNISYQYQPIYQLAGYNNKSDYSINLKDKNKTKIETTFDIDNLNIQLSNGNFSEKKKWDLTYRGNSTSDKDSLSKDTIIRRLMDNATHFLISYPADINLRHQFVSRKTPDHYYHDKKIIDFSIQKLTPIWSKVYKELIRFQYEEANFRIDLTKKAEVESVNIKEEIQNWKRGSKNPLVDLANKCLNPVINHFGLEIETDFPRIQNINVIRAKSTLNNKIVPFHKLSSGTKQIILTALPLYELNTENSIILVDEPELSLYPDIQQMIINYYTELAPEAQFFYATHSPIIASSFEPWEIVELKFDYKKGKVYREEYYDINEERHIDNYFINPQYLRWDSILTKVFDLKEKGNEKRIKKLMELAALGKKIEKENEKPKKAEIYKEYKKLAELLDWETK